MSRAAVATRSGSETHTSSKASVWRASVAAALVIGFIGEAAGAVTTHPYPDDALFQRQWALRGVSWHGRVRHLGIDAVDAWTLTRCSPSVTIAIVDTGVDRQIDLTPQFVAGRSFVPGHPWWSDDYGHGTRVAGIAAGATNNQVGIAGVCPQGRLMPVKIAGADGGSSPAVLAQGIRWAVDHHASVVNVSFGAFYPDVAVGAAVDYAYRHNVVVVAGTGNTGTQVAFYPAAYPHVLAVGGTDGMGRRWRLSSYGERDLVMAPAVGVLATAPFDVFDSSMAGTSVSTALVSGLVALILSMHPGLSVDRVIELVEAGAVPLPDQHGFGPVDGWGQVDCFRSLQLAELASSGAPVA